MSAEEVHAEAIRLGTLLQGIIDAKRRVRHLSLFPPPPPPPNGSCTTPYANVVCFHAQEKRTQKRLRRLQEEISHIERRRRLLTPEPLTSDHQVSAPPEIVPADTDPTAPGTHRKGCFAQVFLPPIHHGPDIAEEEGPALDEDAAPERKGTETYRAYKLSQWKMHSTGVFRRTLGKAVSLPALPKLGVPRKVKAEAPAPPQQTFGLFPSKPRF